MQRRNFFGSLLGLVSALCLKPSKAASTTVYRGVYVGEEAGVPLWFCRYDSPKGPWIGWLDDKSGQCWGFVNRYNVVAELHCSGPIAGKISMDGNLTLQSHPRLHIVRRRNRQPNH